MKITNTSKPPHTDGTQKKALLKFKQIFAHFLLPLFGFFRCKITFIFVALSAWHSFQSHPFIYNVNEGEAVAGGSAFVVVEGLVGKSRQQWNLYAIFSTKNTCEAQGGGEANQSTHWLGPDLVRGPWTDPNVRPRHTHSPAYLIERPPFCCSRNRVIPAAN